MLRECNYQAEHGDVKECCKGRGGGGAGFSLALVGVLLWVAAGLRHNGRSRMMADFYVAGIVGGVQWDDSERERTWKEERGTDWLDIPESGEVFPQKLFACYFDPLSSFLS